MRTLRDERSMLAQDTGSDMLDVSAFWKEYGSYRVVEGVLVLASPGNLVVALEVDDTNPHPDVKLGMLGNHVKLLLPPEEKKPLGAKVAIDTAMALVREHAARADRYEKVLREMAEHGEAMRAGREGGVQFARGKRSAWSFVAFMARGALDENDGA